METGNYYSGFRASGPLVTIRDNKDYLLLLYHYYRVGGPPKECLTWKSSTGTPTTKVGEFGIGYCGYALPGRCRDLTFT